MSRLTVFVLATCFAAMSSFVAAKQPEKKAVVADTPEKFEVLVNSIQQDMAQGRRYEFLSKANRQLVNDSFVRMAAMLTAAGSIDAMSPDQQAKLFNVQEKVNGILAKNADDRLVCSNSAPTGSHIPMTTCHTVRELANSRAAAKDQFNDLSNKANAEYTRTLNSESGG